MRWLQHPLTRDLDLDDPRTTVLRRRILREKAFLRRTYDEWFDHLIAALPDGDRPVLEIGTGASFLAERLPGLIRSDLLPLPGLDLVLDGLRLPFADASLGALLMTNTLHHIREPERFLRQAARCVAVGGTVAMVEPWVSRWSRWVYRALHHEPFEPETPEWTLPSGGPLSTANGALPWILFARDRERFERRLPMWKIRSIAPTMPFRYLLSGGMAYRALMPAATFPVWRAIERLLAPWHETWACFAVVVLERVAGAPEEIASTAP